VLDQAALASYVPLVSSTIKAAGARNFNTSGGKIFAFTGEPPKRVAVIEWDSMEQAQTYLNSTAWKNLAPQRDKAEKITRSYVVEAVANKRSRIVATPHLQRSLPGPRLRGIIS
jgi:uncharacterized protein (DUF1330 family)